MSGLGEVKATLTHHFFQMGDNAEACRQDDEAAHLAEQALVPRCSMVGGGNFAEGRRLGNEALRRRRRRLHVLR